MPMSVESLQFCPGMSLPALRALPPRVVDMGTWTREIGRLRWASLAGPIPTSRLRPSSR